MLSHSDALCFAIRFKVIFFVGVVFLSVLMVCARMEIKKTSGLKRDKIPQPRQVRSKGFQPGLYDV